MPDGPPSIPLPERIRGALANIRSLLVSLADLDFRQMVAPRMLPTLYLLSILAAAYAVLGYAVDGFATSPARGWSRLLLVAPVAFVFMVALSRVALEACLALFRLAAHVEVLSGHAEDIAGGLPRIQFWRAFRRKSEAERGSGVRG